MSDATRDNSVSRKPSAAAATAAGWPLGMADAARPAMRRRSAMMAT